MDPSIVKIGEVMSGLWRRGELAISRFVGVVGLRTVSARRVAKCGCEWITYMLF